MPSSQPESQAVLETGINAGIGGFDFLQPMICGNRKKATTGKFDSFNISITS
jgi:hypothetical protein